ncbi:hypothetical protein [Actinokineospora iranica]|uniref:Uncharacterized protein n=1 Tax=Actinokineospora iranica TaxID=1271860 RepID=A0A1G6ZD39_9PSEU|nr:hypothetical protein [Actinokineospora iranica]SDE00490.1 hypothetical protein SAMN05216174_12828 [Actinokineospora iranica]
MVDYCFKWNFADGAVGIPLTEAEARARDVAGEEYTAIMSPRAGAKSPTLVTVVWKTGVVVVSFLDDPGRKAVEYTFMKKTDESLFLTQVHTWNYPNDRRGLRLSDCTSHETVHYREDGYAKRVVKNKVERFQETVEYNDVRVDANWEPIPAFGGYRSLARFERDEPVANGNL